MNARTTESASSGAAMLGVLRGLLLLEAAAMLAVTIFLSMLAGGVENALGDGSAAIRIQFVAGGTLVFAIMAAFASRGVRRRRGSAWTLAAVLQVTMAIGTGVAILVAEWHPILLIGFALPTIVMLVLSTASVRRALGQP